MNRKSTKRSYRPSGAKATVDSELIPHLSTQPYQKLTTIKIPSTSILIACSALGNVSSAFGLNAGFIDTPSRYNFFDEFRLIKVVVEIRPVASTTTSGLTVFYIDETDVTAPTLAQAQRHVGNALSNNGQAMTVSRGVGRRTAVEGSGIQQLVWTARDLADLTFQPIANFSTVVPASLKAYTDNANFGTPAVAQPLFVIRAHMTYQFRGQN